MSLSQSSSVFGHSSVLGMTKPAVMSFRITSCFLTVYVAVLALLVGADASGVALRLLTGSGVALRWTDSGVALRLLTNCLTLVGTDFSFKLDQYSVHMSGTSLYKKKTSRKKKKKKNGMDQSTYA